MIGYDSKIDEENGFRVSKKGIVLVTRDMLAAYNQRQQANKEKLKLSAV